MATFDCPTNPNPTPTTPCTDPNAHAVALDVPAVHVAIHRHGAGDGSSAGAGQWRLLRESGNYVTNDFDCRFTHSSPAAQNQRSTRAAVRSLCQRQLRPLSGLLRDAGTEPPPAAYSGNVQWFITWNFDTFVPPSIYAAEPRLYDDPDYAVTPQSAVGTDCGQGMTINGVSQSYNCQFEYDFTTVLVLGKKVDTGIGGTTRQFNDVVVAFPPANVPQLQATSAPDAASVSAGSAIGFTVTVTNSGTAAASNVSINDPLPSGTGVNWTISPTVAGCAITGTAPNQVLGCTFTTIAANSSSNVHVTSATSSAGIYTNTAVVALNGQQLLTIASLTVQQLVPAFSGLTPSQTITLGTASITLAGTISAGAQFPPNTENVSITINGSTVPAAIGTGGTFSVSFPTAAIPASATPYPITYSYAGDTNFTSASDSSTTLTVNAVTQSFTLSVALIGTGTGSVSDNDGISCSEASGVVSGTCSGSFASGTMLTLTASATSPSTFAGWGGACASFGTATACTVTVNAATNVTANFVPPPQSVNVTFNPGTNVPQMATYNCPSNSNPCTDPNAHAIQLMIPTVLAPFTVTVQAIEVPPGQANGDCSPGNTVNNDFDCRFSQFFPFGTAQDGGKLVPLCDPYANGNCVHYLVFSGSPGNEPPATAYSGGVQWFITWNHDTFVPPSIYTTPPRLYDDPDYAVTPQSAIGTDCSQGMTINGA